MRTVLRAAVLALLVLGVASRASAADKVWSVPGVMNDGLATVFSCTNGGTSAANVKVELFAADGTANASATVNVASGATADFATQNVAAFPFGSIEANLSSSTMHSGSARITAPSGVYCTAGLFDQTNNPPTSMRALPVIKKTTQKGD